MFTPSGTWIRIRARNARSSASRSISRLWIRISHRSHVSDPSPSGDFRTGTTRRFVGSGIAPLTATPVRSEIVLICWHTLSTFFGSVPLSEIRALCGIHVHQKELMKRGEGSPLLDIDHLARRDGLAHVADGEAAHLREVLERLDDHRLRRADLYNRGLAGLQVVRLLRHRLPGLRVELLDEVL